MIVPKAYNDLFHKHKLFIVGRKGSGKSTFLEMLKRLDERVYNDCYKSLEIVKYDDLPIQQIYMYWRLCKNDASIYSKEDFLKLFIEVYVFLYSVCVVGMEIEKGNLDTDPRKEKFTKLTEKLKAALKIDNENFSDQEKLFESLGTTSVDILRRYLVIKKADDNGYEEPDSSTIFEFMTDKAYSGSATIHMTWKSVLSSFFCDDGQESSNDVNNYIEALNACKKRILFALDGFDNDSDNFRIDTNDKLVSTKPEVQDEGKQRIEFIKKFDAQLVITLDALKENERSNFTSKIDFCVIFPRDRYEVFRDEIRDISKVPFYFLNWDAYELMDMATRRLEFFLSKLLHRAPEDRGYEVLLSKEVNVNMLTQCNADADVWTRFEHAVNQLLPKIPLRVVLGNNEEISLFNYILSLSMWRPRDILHYIYMLFNISRNSAGMSDSSVAMNEAIRDGMTSTSITILSDEFIQEYNKVFRNITPVLNSLKGVEIIPKNKYLGDNLRDRFDTSFAFDDGTYSSKLRILFELGVIGIVLEQDEIEIYQLLDKYCYVYCHGNMTHESIEFNERLHIVVNPMFKTRLLLNVNLNQGEVIGNYSRKRIEHLHRIKDSLPDW